MIYSLGRYEMLLWSCRVHSGWPFWIPICRNKKFWHPCKSLSMNVAIKTLAFHDLCLKSVYNWVYLGSPSWVFICDLLHQSLLECPQACIYESFSTIYIDICRDRPLGNYLKAMYHMWHEIKTQYNRWAISETNKLHQNWSGIFILIILITMSYLLYFWHTDILQFTNFFLVTGFAYICKGVTI